MRKITLNKKVSLQGIVLFLIVILGVLYVSYIWTNAENEEFDHALQIARSITASLPKEDLKALEAKPGDIDKPQYQVIKNSLKAVIHVNTNARFAYIYTEQNGKVYFFADSEPEDSEEYSPPGQEYTEANPEDKQPFKDGKELITVSMPDRWGTWTRVLIPIKDEATGKTIAVFGMDFNAKSMSNYVLLEIIESSVIIALMLLALLFLFKTKAKNKLLKCDIAELMRAEEALKNSLSLTDATLNSIHNGILVVNNQATVIKTNAKFAEIWQIPSDIIASADDKTLVDFIIEQIDDPAGFIARVSEVHGKPETETSDLIYFRNGRIVERISKPMYLGGEPKGRVWSFLDITERKQAGKALRESEALYRNLIEKLLDGVYKSTHDGKFVEVNPAMVTMLGYESKEELMAIDIKTQLYFETVDRDSLVLQEKLEEMGVYRLKKKDGSEIWVEDHGWYNLDGNGNILFHEGIMRDITKRKQAEEEIKLKNEELIKLLTEKDKFFSIIAHDLRSPFNGFLGLTQIMAEELPSLTRDEIQEFVLRMRNSATNLYRLLENLLEWARMQQGLIPFEPEVVELLLIVDECIAIVLETIKSKGIEIAYDIPYDIKVFADSNILQSVIRNLISNAVKFTPKGGKISLSAKTYTDKCVEIAIKDSGIGMSRAMVDHLFRLDVQTNREGTEGEPSTGLGLLLCKEFIEKHGGKIWVESKEGKGSIFYFTIPYKAKLEEINVIKNVVSADKADNQIKDLKILIVEDDEGSAMIISMAVKIFAKEVVKVRTGVEAVEACHNNPDIDLVLMDIQMPGMDGYEATRQIRQFNKEVIIIAQTAYALTGDRENAIEAGCNDYISKPIKKDKLLGLMHKYFKK